MKGDEIVQPYDRHSIETVTLRKHVSKYKKHAKIDGPIYLKIVESCN